MGVTYSRINPRERRVGCPFHRAVPSFSTRALCLVGPANYHIVTVKKVRNLGIFYMNFRKILIIKKKKNMAIMKVMWGLLSSEKKQNGKPFVIKEND